MENNKIHRPSDGPTEAQSGPLEPVRLDPVEAGAPVESRADPIAQSLAPLFERADREGLWFYCYYQGMWFSPAELRGHQATGRFRWGAVNWVLRDPKELLESARRSVGTAAQEAAAVEARLHKAGVL